MFPISVLRRPSIFKNLKHKDLGGLGGSILKAIWNASEIWTGPQRLVYCEYARPLLSRSTRLDSMFHQQMIKNMSDIKLMVFFYQSVLWNISLELLELVSIVSSNNCHIV